MELQQALDVLNKLVHDGVRIIDIEKELGIPKNHLSGFLRGARTIPKKWQTTLISYAKRVDDARKPEPKVLLPPTEKSAPTIAKEPETPPKTAKALPPAGLSKTETIKWYRQHNQTLQ